MCGIFGVTGKTHCVEVIFEGLKKLEYRGYDSSGIVTLDNDQMHVVKSQGKLSELAKTLNILPQDSKIGMGHTRWATHGVPNTINAHPHNSEDIALIHNGILENESSLRKQLIGKGYKFTSDTDSEVILHLFSSILKEENGNIHNALIKTAGKVEGTFGIALMLKSHPKSIFVIKHQSPIVIGHGQNQNFLASDALSLINHTQRFTFLEDHQFAEITPNEVNIFDWQGNIQPTNITEIPWSGQSVEKLGFKHFMLKEIHQQPQILANMLQRFISPEEDQIDLKIPGDFQIDWSKVSRIHLVACGTAYYAAMTAMYSIEPLAGIPVSVELASEFRYRDPQLPPGTLVIPMTQSGETIDTLASVKLAKEKGCTILAVANVKFSSIPRESHATLYMEAGSEIGVASTKAFTSMVLSLYFIALAAAIKKNKISKDQLKSKITKLKRLPHLCEQALLATDHIEKMSRLFENTHSFLFVGRGIHYPIALEGALKLKEISYIHAEGYGAGELKHGPIALVDPNIPVVALVANDHLKNKTLANIKEITARQGVIIGVGDKKHLDWDEVCEHFIHCPSIEDNILQSIVSAIPLQLLAYHIANYRGTDIDQPRNLAKSVTVE